MRRLILTSTAVLSAVFALLATTAPIARADESCEGSDILCGPDHCEKFCEPAGSQNCYIVCQLTRKIET